MNPMYLFLSKLSLRTGNKQAETGHTFTKYSFSKKNEVGNVFTESFCSNSVLSVISNHLVDFLVVWKCPISVVSLPILSDSLEEVRYVGLSSDDNLSFSWMWHPLLQSWMDSTVPTLHKKKWRLLIGTNWKLS